MVSGMSRNPNSFSQQPVLAGVTAGVT